MRYSVEQGCGVTLSDNVTGRAVFFQPGDDSAAFLTHYEPLADCLGPDQAAAELWQDYRHCAA
jgi:hypothetical protein